MKINELLNSINKKKLILFTILFIVGLLFIIIFAFIWHKYCFLYALAKTVKYLTPILAIIVAFISAILGCASLIIQSIIKQREKLIELQQFNYNVICKCSDSIKNINKSSYIKIIDDNGKECIQTQISQIEHNISQIQKYQTNITNYLNNIDEFNQLPITILKWINIQVNKILK